MMGLPSNWLIGVCASMFVHVMCARAALRMEAPPGPPPPPMEVELAPPPESKAAVEPPPPEPPKARAPARQRSAARAGRVVAAEPAPSTDDTPVDFSIVQGAADAYVGGTTQATGTSDVPVRGAVTPSANVTSEGTALAASPAGSEWDCSALYPTAPTTPDAAAVLVQARVDATGSPIAVDVLRDPGHGFGAAARICAMRQTYQPARNRAGEAVAGRTKPFFVRFHR